jgi:hypothetical protein
MRMCSLVFAFSVCLVVLISPAWAGTIDSGFDGYFTDQTMRIDYHHTGDATTEIVSIDRIYEYGTWAGSVQNLVDSLNYGAYYHKIYDAASGELIYSRGFDSYFKEYQVSSKAGAGVVKTFHESAIIPSPRAKIIFALDKRQKEGQLEEVFRTEIDPEDVQIIRGEAADPSVLVVKSLSSGNPHVKADIAIIAEGYTAQEEQKFRDDLARFTETFFKQDPCKSYKNRFNIYGVFKPSLESGIDEPRHGSFHRTAVSATFNSMGSERYVLTEDNKALRDIARHVPYDALYIMINHHRYGGGGIYNFYCTFTAHNQWSEYLMVHEFGHSFFGLADEYYTSDVAYSDFYPAGYEPAEPNITAALDPDNLKWKHLLTPGIDIPTPWEKAAYDEMSLTWQKERRELNDRIAGLRRRGAPEAEVKEVEALYDRRDREVAMKINKYLNNSKYAGQVGLLQGAGYASTGLYRSMTDCIMFTKAQKNFCRVCQDAMVKVIEWYSE